MVAPAASGAFNAPVSGARTRSGRRLRPRAGGAPLWARLASRRASGRALPLRRPRPRRRSPLARILRTGRLADPGDGRAQHALDVLELLDVVGGDDGQRAAFLAGPAGAADAVDVVVRLPGHVEIEDVAHVRDVEAARRHVARRQQRDVGLPECSSVSVRLNWSMSPCSAAGIEAVLAAATCRRIATSRLRLQKMMAFLTCSAPISSRSTSRFSQSSIAGAEAEQLGDGVRGGGRRGDLDARRVVQEGIDQALDLRRHGGREEQRLPAWRQQLADLLDVGDEAHVEHAVGLVDHQDLDAAQQDLAALELVEQASGRGDQHVDAAVELPELVVERHAADQQRHRQLVVDLPYFSKLCATWAASSRVGARISERGMRARARPASSRTSIGSTKPAVLPVPVCAMPSTSRPVTATGMA